MSTPDLAKRRAELVSIATVEPEQPSGDNANVIDAVLEETLGQLHGASTNPEFKAALAALAQGMVPFDLLERQLARAGAIRGLEDMKVKGAAGLVDAALAAYAKANGAPNTNVGQPAAFADLEPWSDPVDGAELLNTLQAFLCRFLILPTGAADVLATFALVTHAADAFSTAPYLALESPTAECGKTRVLEILALLTARPWFTLMPSTAVLFRVLEEYHPTMLLDECQAVRGHGETAENVRDLLLAGYKRGATVPRCVGDRHEVRFFDVFGPKVFALIGELPGALASRCIRIGMQRRRPHESVDSLLGVEGEALILARKARRWANDHRETLQGTTPPFPGFLQDRLAEIWRPLLAVGIVAGGGWDARLIDAARALATGRDDDDVRTLLLADIRDLFDNRRVNRLKSEDIVEALVKMEERPWPEWCRGNSLSKAAMARQLKGFDIRPKMIRIGNETVRGYDRKWFEDAFARYLPPQTATPATPPENTGGFPDPDRNISDTMLRSGNSESPAKTGHVAGVAVEQGGDRAQKVSGPGLEPLTASFWSSLPEDVPELDPDEEARTAMQEGA